MFDSDNAGVLDAHKLQQGLQTVSGRTLSADHLHEVCGAVYLSEPGLLAIHRQTWLAKSIRAPEDVPES